MADADHSLELLIKTKADLGAAKAVAVELDRSILRAKLLGKSFAEQEAQLKKVNAEIAAFTEKNGEAGKESKLFEGHMGEVKKSIRELSHEFPLAASALRLLTNPVGGALAIAIGMFALAKQKLDDWNKELEETAEILRKPDFADGIKARKDALEAAEIAATSYADKMANLIDPEEAFQKSILAEIGLLKARNDAEARVSDAVHGLDEAKLKHAQSVEEAALQKQFNQGKISAEQFEQYKLTLEAAYFAKLTQMEEEHEQAKLAREEKARWDEIKLQDQALTRARNTQPDLDRQAHFASEAAKGAATDVARDEANLKVAEDKKDALEKKVAELEEKIRQGATTFGMTLGQDPMEVLRKAAAMPLTGGHYKKQLDAYNDAVADRDRNAGVIANLTGRLPREREGATQAHDAVAPAQSRRSINAQRINDLEIALQDSKDRANLAGNADNKVGGSDAQKLFIELRDKSANAPIGGGYTVGSQQRYEDLAALAAKGTHLNGEQQKFVRDFGTFIQNQLAWHTSIGPLLLESAKASVSNQRDFAASIETLNKEMAILKNRIKDINLK